MAERKRKWYGKEGSQNIHVRKIMKEIHHDKYS